MTVTADTTTAAATAQQWFQDAFSVYAQNTFPLLYEVTWFLLDKSDGGVLVSASSACCASLCSTVLLLHHVVFAVISLRILPFNFVPMHVLLVHTQREYDTNDPVSIAGFKNGFAAVRNQL